MLAHFPVNEKREKVLPNKKQNSKKSKHKQKVRLNGDGDASRYSTCILNLAIRNLRYICFDLLKQKATLLISHQYLKYYLTLKYYERITCEFSVKTNTL